jgi:hypothetical protein
MRKKLFEKSLLEYRVEKIRFQFTMSHYLYNLGSAMGNEGLCEVIQPAILQPNVGDGKILL